MVKLTDIWWKNCNRILLASKSKIFSDIKTEIWILWMICEKDKTKCYFNNVKNNFSYVFSNENL